MGLQTLQIGTLAVTFVVPKVSIPNSEIWNKSKYVPISEISQQSTACPKSRIQISQFQTKACIVNGSWSWTWFGWLMGLGNSAPLWCSVGHTNQPTGNKFLETLLKCPWLCLSIKIKWPENILTLMGPWSTRMKNRNHFWLGQENYGNNTFSVAVRMAGVSLGVGVGNSHSVSSVCGHGIS